jgi:hypothetical protein
MHRILHGALACAFALSFPILGCGGGKEQLLPIGSPCHASSECGTTAAWFCAMHPGGYCKKDCKTDAECPSEAICVHEGSSGECHKNCDKDSDCRSAEGYACKPASSDPDTLATHAFCDVMEEAMGDMGLMPDGGAGDAAQGD